MSPYDFNTFTAWNNVLGTFFCGSTTMVERVLGGAVEGRTMVIKDNSPVLAGIYPLMCIYISTYIHLELELHFVNHKESLSLFDAQIISNPLVWF